MFTKRHMIAVAAIIAKIKDMTERTKEHNEFAKMFRESNPLFDSKKFAVACGMVKKQGK